MNTEQEHTDGPENSSQRNQALGPPEQTLTLDPLIEEGAQALLPDEDDEVASVRLETVEIAANNAFHDITTKTGDDLFRSAPWHPEYFPHGPCGIEIVSAILTVIFRGTSTKHNVQISPPADLKFEFPDDRPRMLPFLQKRRFTRIAQATAASVIAALLSLSSVHPSPADTQLSTLDSQPELTDCPASDQDTTVPSGDTTPVPPSDIADLVPPEVRCRCRLSRFLTLTL